MPLINLPELFPILRVFFIFLQKNIKWESKLTRMTWWERFLKERRCGGLSSAAAFTAASGTWTSCSQLKTELSEWLPINQEGGTKFSLCHICNPILPSQACSYLFYVCFSLSFLYPTWPVLPLLSSCCFSILALLRMSFDSQCFCCDIIKWGTASSGGFLWTLPHCVANSGVHILCALCIHSSNSQSNTTCKQVIGSAGAIINCVKI